MLAGRTSIVNKEKDRAEEIALRIWSSYLWWLTILSVLQWLSERSSWAKNEKRKKEKDSKRCWGAKQVKCCHYPDKKCSWVADFNSGPGCLVSWTLFSGRIILVQGWVFVSSVVEKRGGGVREEILQWYKSEAPPILFCLWFRETWSNVLYTSALKLGSVWGDCTMINDCCL